jgi:quercetin dioxygenase-like cupin family protein
MSWGKLIWRVAGSLGNTDQLTLGNCLIDQGQQNGRHYHPNCEELLIVVRGEIVHTWDELEVTMGEGDVIAIPPGVVHNARNVGEGIADLLVCFSTPDRLTIDV